MLDDPNLLTAVRSFLDSPTDHTLIEGTNFRDSNVQKAWTALVDSIGTLRSIFRTSTMRPPSNATSSQPTLSTIPETRVRNMSTRSTPDIDAANAEEFVDNLDGMACAAFTNISEEVGHYHSVEACLLI